MDYNYNFFNAYSDSYFSLTSFNSDITNLALHKFNQPSMPDWSYLNQYMPQSQYYEQECDNHHYFSRDTTSLSLTINNLANKRLHIIHTKINL